MWSGHIPGNLPEASDRAYNEVIAEGRPRRYDEVMTNKQLVLETVRKLPDTATLEQIAEEIALLAAIRRGEQAADTGRVTPQEEVKRLVASWTAK